MPCSTRYPQVALTPLSGTATGSCADEWARVVLPVPVLAYLQPVNGQGVALPQAAVRGYHDFKQPAAALGTAASEAMLQALYTSLQVCAPGGREGRGMRVGWMGDERGTTG